MARIIPLNENLPACKLGEGIIWDPAIQEIFWVDIDGQQLHRYNPATKTHKNHHYDEKISFLIPAINGDLLAGLGTALYLIHKESGKARLLKEIPMPAPARFNDAAADSSGRLWAGTMSLAQPPRPDGVLYCFDRGQPVIRDRNFKISNGIGWSPDEKILYHSDTEENIIWAYDYEHTSGALSARRIFAKNHGGGKPDGLCVDRKGFVYSAQWDGGAINIYAPDGTLAEILKIPVAHVTSCCFGGPALRTLYITTAKGDDKAPLAGHVFTTECENPGLPGHPARFS